MSFSITDPGFPDEWIYDADGQPTCTHYLGDEPVQYRCVKTVDMFSPQTRARTPVGRAMQEQLPRTQGNTEVNHVK